MKYNLLIAALWTLLALVILWQYDPVGRRLDPDASFMVYAGQQILRGHAPYVGVTIVKLPVSALVAAGGMAAGRVYGIDDILAVRIAFWLCAAVAVGAVYLIGTQLAQHGTQKDTAELKEDTDTSKTAAWEPVLLGSLAAAVLVSFQALGIQVAEGPEAKLPMVCAGMLCLVLLAREKFFWAGLAGTLSFLAWQPGLIFVAAAVIAALVKHFATSPSQRGRAVLMTVGGIAVPLLVIGAYLVLNGALGSMFRQAFGANANYLEEKKVAVGVASIVAANLVKVWNVSLACSPTELPFIYLGYVGMLGGGAWLAFRMWRTRSVPLFLAAFPLLLSGAALFAFSLLDLQKCSDLVPLLPYLALGVGGVIFAVLVTVWRWLARQPTVAARASVVFGAFALAAVGLVLLWGSVDAFASPRQDGLAQQRELAYAIAARLEPQDAAQQFGDALFLVTTGRENATRFVHLGEKQGLGILTAEGISMDQLTAQLAAVNPRVITLSRAKDKTWAQPLYAWLDLHYALESSYGTAAGGYQKELDVYWRK